MLPLEGDHPRCHALWRLRSVWVSTERDSHNVTATVEDVQRLPWHLPARLPCKFKRETGKLICLIACLAVDITDGGCCEVHIEVGVVVDWRVVSRAGSHEINVTLPRALSVNDTHNYRRSRAGHCTERLIALLIENPTVGCRSTQRSKGNDELPRSFFLVCATRRPHGSANLSQFTRRQHWWWARWW